VSEERDPALYFSAVLQERTYGNLTYTVVAPAAALEMVLLVAGECFNAAEYAEKKLLGSPDVGAAVKGFICGFFVILTGVFAVLEYLIAFLEYMLIAGVGIIFFPLSLWEGSRFMSEKFVGAVTGFFVKLLMSNICIFLMLYGFMSLARTFTLNNFTGEVDQIVTVIFVSLLFFYICKSAPGLAQSLLTGTPSLSATGAISAMAGAGAAAMGAAKLAGKAGGAVAGGAAKTAFGAGGALQQAGATSAAVKEKGGSIGDQAKAFMGSMAGSAGETLKAGAGDLARSLIGGRGGSGGAGGRGPGAGAGSGLNRHSQTEKFLNEKNEDGTKKTFKEQADSRRAAGTEAGIDYMAKKEARQNGGNGAAAEKEEGRQTAASGRPHGLAIEKMNAGDRAQNPAAEGKSSGSSAQAGEGPAPATEQASRHADEGKACGGSGGNGAE
jgi:type IV secretion system protein TrbL